MSPPPRSTSEPDRVGWKKQAVALGSDLTSAPLASTKLITGWGTGSLAVLAQAVDYGLDLMTTLTTYLAVRWAEIRYPGIAIGVMLFSIGVDLERRLHRRLPYVHQVVVHTEPS